MAIPNANTDDAMHPMMVYNITAKALIGVKPPISMPQNNRGSEASANADRFAMVGDNIAKRLVLKNGIRALHGEAPLPSRKSYWARLR